MLLKADRSHIGAEVFSSPSTSATQVQSRLDVEIGFRYMHDFIVFWNLSEIFLPIQKLEILLFVAVQ